MSNLSILHEPMSKDLFIQWLKRLGSLPDAFKAVTYQPYLPGKDAAKRAVAYIQKNQIEDECYQILDNFAEMQVKCSLTKDELATKMSELILAPHVKPVDTIKAAECLMKLKGWEVKKTQSEIITAKTDMQEFLKKKIKSPSPD